jgi:hypothetical protein
MPASAPLSSTVRRQVNGMRSIPIAQIEVAESGLISVAPAVPTSEHFEHIYRTATGVRWLPASRSFSPARMAELSHANGSRRLSVQLPVSTASNWRLRRTPSGRMSRPPSGRKSSRVAAGCRLTPRWSGRVKDKVPSSDVGVRAAQLNR